MTQIYVQFEDTTDEVVVSCFGGPQDETVWSNQSIVDSSDLRWKAYYDKQAFTIQQMLPAPTAMPD